MYLYLDVKSNSVGLSISVPSIYNFYADMRLVTCMCVCVVLYLVTEDVAVDRGVIVVTALYRYVLKLDHI